MKLPARNSTAAPEFPLKVYPPFVASLVIVAAIAVYCLQPGWFVRIDLMIYDWLLPLRAEKTVTASPEIVIVDIDEASTKEFGQWPWPRHHIASLIDSLTAYEAGAIGLDILFVESDRMSPARLRESLPRGRNLSFHYSFAPDSFSDYDRMLADSFDQSAAAREESDQGRVVIAAYALAAREGGQSPPSPAHAILVRESAGNTDWKSFVPGSAEAILPLPVLRAAADIGFINADVDVDGVTRTIPLVYRFGGHIYPSMSVSVLMSYFGAGGFVLQSGQYGLESIQVADFSARISPQGKLMIPFAGGRGTYTYVSAVDVINRSAAREKLEGNIVLVGSTLTALADIRSTPRDATHPGVEIHAAAIDALLTGNAIIIPQHARTVQVVLVCLAALPLVMFYLRRPFLHGAAAVLALALIIGLPVCFFSRGVFVSPLYGFLAWAALCVFGVLLWLLRFRLQWREEERKKRMLSRYSSAEVARKITESPEDLAIGKRQVVSIMFSDIRGFTGLSKKLLPEVVVSILNRYFKIMLDLVEEHSGTTDKLIGDALMAYWNAPNEMPGHYIEAIKAALAMQEALPEFNEVMEKEMNLAPMRVSIGVHTGEAFSGNMGTEDFATYTLIGDNVNLTSRLAGLSSQYETGIVVSEDIKTLCGEAFSFRRLDTVIVLGRDDLPVTIYEPMHREEAELREEELAMWDEARDKYAAGEFEEAKRSLAILRETWPETRLYEVFAKRVDNFLQNPPDSWSGIWKSAEK